MLYKYMKMHVTYFEMNEQEEMAFGFLVEPKVP